METPKATDPFDVWHRWAGYHEYWKGRPRGFCPAKAWQEGWDMARDEEAKVEGAWEKHQGNNAK